MKRYKFELIINEGCDEFWEGIADKTGCDEVIKMLLGILEDNGLDEDSQLKLVEYTNGN